MPEENRIGPGTGADEPDLAADSVAARPHSAAFHTTQSRNVLNELAASLFDVAVLVKTAVDLPGDAIRLHITEALSRLDDAVQAAHDHVSAERGRDVQSILAASPLGEPGRLRWSAGRAALLRERMAQTVRALQRSAAETVGLLEQRVEIAGEPGRIDYRTEIKRWQRFADQAEELAKRLE